MKKFYILLDKTNLTYFRDEYDYTRYIEKAIHFETLDDTVKYLASCDDDVISKSVIYEVTEEIERNFKLIKEKE